MDKITYIKKAESIHGDTYIYRSLPETFKGTDKITIECKEHGPFQQIARNHIGKQASGCPICGRKKANLKITDTFEEFLRKEKKVHRNKYEPLKETFTCTKNKLKIKCNKCGNIFEQTGTMHLAGNGCSFCNPPHKRRTTEDFKNELSKTHPNLELLSEYINSNTKIKVRCKIHDYTYETTPHRLKQGSNCQKCYDDRRGLSIKKPIDKLISEITCKHGDRYEIPMLEDEYKSNKSKLTCICKNGHVFRITANKLLKGQGCHFCNESHLEKEISLILPNINRWYTDLWLKNPNTKHPLVLDFYDEKQNIAIECQGDQHFRPYEIWGGKEGYKKNVERDIIKNTLCKNHNTRLIYIMSKTFKDKINEKHYNGIYKKDVYFIEDIQKDPDILRKILI